MAYAKYKEAIEHFNASLKIEYNQAKTHMLMGYAFKQLEQEDNAINCFRNAVNVDPEFKEAFVQLGQMFHVRGDATAVVYYDNALRVDPTDEMILYKKAMFYQSIMQWNAALEAYADQGDLLVLISSSGKSQNILNGAKKAKEIPDLYQFLSIIAQESKLSTVGFFNIHKIVKEHKLKTIPKKETLFQKIKSKKYKVSLTHFNPISIRSNIPLKELIKVIKSIK